MPRAWFDVIRRGVSTANPDCAMIVLHRHGDEGTAKRMMPSLQARLDHWANDDSLQAPEQLRARVEVIDWLDEALIDAENESGSTALIDQARALRDGLETINRRIYRDIRHDIQQGRGAQRLLKWVPHPLFENTPDQHGDGEQYDYLDALLTGIASWDEPGDDIAPLVQDMVFYQPTPARHIFDLIHRLSLSRDDVLIDLGAGLGHVPLLAAICTSARCVGVEWERAYVACAQRSANALKLANASFVREDARIADVSHGTVFYLYTPFSGAMLRAVLDRLAAQAATRAIRICTLGPCTQVIAGESWLTPMDAQQSPDRIAVFRGARL
jgi:hypothetical protein